MGCRATIIGMLSVGMLSAACLLPAASHAREVVEDTVTGAAKGAVIGAIAGDAGKGAAAGAVGGALFGGMTKEP
ncbi:MAG: glycine zipper family protein, partial [Sedimenticolaceae bacterium]